MWNNKSCHNTTETVTYQINSTTLPSNANSGDWTFVTDTGDSTGTISEKWLYDGAQWKKIPTGIGQQTIINYYDSVNTGDFDSTYLNIAFSGVDGILSKTYTPTLVGGKLLIEIDADYAFFGIGTDDFHSEIRVGSTIVGSGKNQIMRAAGGGGTRSNDLVPLRAMIDIVDTSPLLITLAAWIVAGDDNLIFGSGNMKLTEILN